MIKKKKKKCGKNLFDVDAKIKKNNM